ncbi:MAG: T9SS type A sorting domain-containing protein [Bacteroidales bacterium]
MRTITFLKTIALFAGLMLSVSAYADYVVDFEGPGETKGAYASGTVNLSGLDWNMTEVLIGTEANDFKNGDRSARLRGYGTSAMTMLEDKTNGIGTISFLYRRYGTDEQADWKVEYSTDEGDNWIQIGSNFTAPASNDVQTFSEIVEVAGNVRVRIKRATEAGTQNRRLNIDDITITDYLGGGTPTVSAPVFTPPAGNYYAPQSVEISTSTEDAGIMYSLNGKQGTYQEYTVPISVSENTSIWAYGFKMGYNNSDTLNAVYNILAIAQEPENHPTNFTAIANSHNSITLSWTDSDADAYLIKGSDVSFEDIQSPVDGVHEADGGLVKNVVSAKGDHQFTGLEPETEYFFKIFPYNGTGAGINYKTDGQVPEASATTEEAPEQRDIITQWNFDLETLNPNIGEGTATNVGGISDAFAAGNPGKGWNTKDYPAQGTSSGTAGVKFMVSTLGYKDIVLNFDHRASGTASRWAQIEYTTDGGDIWYILGNNEGGLSPHDNFYSFEFDFTEIEDANDNPGFGVRILSIFSPVAFDQNATLTYGPDEAYQRANAQSGPPGTGTGTGDYGPAGTWRFDNVTISGYEIGSSLTPVKLAITDVNGGVSPTVNQPFSVKIQSRTADNLPANVDQDTYVSLSLTTGTGNLGGVLTGLIPEGQNTLELTEVTYNKAENDVTVLAMATGGMTLNFGISAPFNVISPATHLAFVNFPQSGYVNEPVTAFTVEARRPDNTVDPGFTGDITLSLADKTGQVDGTLVVAAVNGIATFNNVFFTEAGNYTLNADSDGLTQATSEEIEVIPLIEPAISGVLVPKFINADSPKNNRLPYAFRATLYNLLPNTTYRYLNQAVLGTDGPKVAGAGNCIFVNVDGDFVRTTSPSFVNAYGEFTTDENGSFTGWFMLETTTNVKFTAGNEIFMRIRINDGAGGTEVAHYLTVQEAITVIMFGENTDVNEGSALKGLSDFTPKNFVFLYDEDMDLRGRPITGTSIETTGVDFSGITQYAAFYRNEVSGVDGAWGTIIPNVNENGVRLIEERSLTDGSIVNTRTSSDGMWGATNTAYPASGTTPLVIDLREQGIQPFLPLHDITITPLIDTCYAAYDTIQTTDFVVQSGGAVQLVSSGVVRMLQGTVVMEGGYLRAWIDPDSIYCSMAATMLAGTDSFTETETVLPIPENTSAFFTVYPNPGNGNFTLRINPAAVQENISLEIFNLIGERLIYRELSETNLYQLDMTSMQSGMYLVRIIHGNKSEVQRIIKQ